MTRGTTPIHTFISRFDINTIDKIRIIYAQNGKIVLIKKNEDCTFTDKTIATKLTQEETFLFDTRFNVEIQIRILTNDGDAYASHIKTIYIDKCLENEVMT